MNKTTISYDFEATSVARDADPVSIGLYAVTEVYKCNRESCHIIKSEEWVNDVCDCLEGIIKKQVEVKTFYAEFDDYNPDKADQWVKDNVISKLKLPTQPYKTNYNNQVVKGNRVDVNIYLKEWVSQFEGVEFWGDFDIIDKPMLVDLLADWEIYKSFTMTGHPSGQPDLNKYKVGLPKHLPNVKYYDFYDLHTLFKIKGIDPDISREEYAGVSADGKKHNALWDAEVRYKCYKKLMS